MEIKLEEDANVMLVNEEFKKKADSPTDLTLEGILSDVKPEYSNACDPIVSSTAFESKLIVVRDPV